MSDPSRREFLVRAGLAGGSLWLLLDARPRAVAAAKASTTREALTESQWKTIEAITGRIIPTDHEPGAIEAGAVRFIDKALAHEDAASKALYEGGVAALDAACGGRFGRPFVECAAEEQDEVLSAVESGAVDGWPAGGVPPAQFFAVVRMHTIIGFLADPAHGCNRGHVVWKVTGYPGGGHHLGGYSSEQMSGAEKIKTAWGSEV